MAHALQRRHRVKVRTARGFTLVEMMVVVVIIGILSVLAIIGYRKLILASHVSEATNMVQNIRVAQEGYHSETQTYANLSASVVTGPWYPNTTPTGLTLTPWGAACGNQCINSTDWSSLPLHVDGPFLFGYATTAGVAGGPQPTDNGFPVNGVTVGIPASMTVDWYMVGADCDLDQNGGNDTHVYTTSWSNQIWIDHEGE